MWAGSHAPRRSHEQNRAGSRSSSTDGDEPRRRTSSDATPRQTPVNPRFLDVDKDANRDASRNVLPPNSSAGGVDVFSSSKRLGYFADKLSSSLSGTGKDVGANLKNSLQSSQLLHPHIHSRTDSAATTTPTNSSVPLMAASSNVAKPHASPSKVP